MKSIYFQSYTSSPLDLYCGDLWIVTCHHHLRRQVKESAIFAPIYDNCISAMRRDGRSPRKAGRLPRPHRLQLEDAENAPSPPGSPAGPGMGSSKAQTHAAGSPSKLSQGAGSSPGSPLRSPLAQRQLQPESPQGPLHTEVGLRASCSLHQSDIESVWELQWSKIAPSGVKVAVR